MSKKICTACKRDLPLSEFTKGKNWKGEYQRGVCKVCTQSIRSGSVSSSPYTYLGQVFSKLKSGRIKQGLEWEIELDYVRALWDLQEGKCALSGVHMTWQAGEGKQDFNVGIDRKDSNKGYIIGNIQLVAQRVNVMKHTLGESEFYCWCKTIVVKKEGDL